jgi:putative spermidine/putrescine transport system substrate-binding protein
MSRKTIKVLGLFAMALCVVVTASEPTESAMGKPPLTIVSWGGAYTKSQMLAYVLPYRQMRNRWVNVEEYNGGLAEIREQVRSLNVKWDVVDIQLSDAVRGCKEGLFEKIDFAILSPSPDGTLATKDYYEETLQDCVVGQNIWATVIAYRSSQFSGKRPTTLKDFFDVKNFPGGRGLRKTAEINLEWALIADGVPPNQVYRVLSSESGINRAFEVLDRIKGEIVWWEKGTHPPELLRAGKVVMTSAWNGRIYNSIKDLGEDFVIVWDGHIRDLGVWVIPKGTNNLEEALDFLVFSSDPKRMAIQAQYIAYGPARKSSMALVGDEVRKYLPTAEENARNALQFNFLWWADNKVAMEKRFAKWLSKGSWRYDFSADDEN